MYQPTGATVPNCVITLSWSVRARSGGHLHNTDRPPGIFTTRNGVTGGSTDPGPPGTLTDSSGSAGVLEFTYTSPQASGITDYTASGLAVVDGKTVLFGPASFTIGVQVGGLQLASGDGLQVNAASDMHGNNNGYATPVTIAALQRMAQIFAANLTKLGKPVPPVRVNALSLPQGGHFDFKVEWQTPHRSHRFGKEADIRIWLTNEQREKLAWALYKAGFSTPVPNERPQDPASSHWHLRMP